MALLGAVLQEGNIVIDMMTRADTDAALNSYAKEYGAPPGPIKEPTRNKIHVSRTLVMFSVRSLLTSLSARRGEADWRRRCG